MLTVFRVFEDTLSVGKMVECDDWSEAYDVAKSMVYQEYKARSIDVSNDKKLIKAIDKAIELNNEYLFDCHDGDCTIAEEGKAVNIVIALTEAISDDDNK